MEYTLWEHPGIYPSDQRIWGIKLDIMYIVYTWLLVLINILWMNIPISEEPFRYVIVKRVLLVYMWHRVKMYDQVLFKEKYLKISEKAVRVKSSRG